MQSSPRRSLACIEFSVKSKRRQGCDKGTGPFRRYYLRLVLFLFDATIDDSDLDTLAFGSFVRFSLDGKKLLVLTAEQAAYAFNVDKLSAR